MKICSSKKIHNIGKQVGIIFIISLFTCILSRGVLAEVMSSETYQIGSDLVGPGSFEAQNSSNYAIAKYPGYNLVIEGEPVEPVEEQSNISRGSGGFISVVRAFNEVLTVNRNQRGILVFDYSENTSLVINSPKDLSNFGTHIIVVGENQSETNRHLIPLDTRLVGSMFWNITAIDFNNKNLAQFNKEVAVTLQVPDIRESAEGLGVYGFNQELRTWELVEKALFVDGAAVFSTKNLTKYALLSKDIPDPILGDTVTPMVVKTPDVYLVPSIQLDLVDTVVYSVDELVAEADFSNFKTPPSAAKISFKILNEEGMQLYASSEINIVKNKGLLSKVLKGIELDYGNYTIVMKALDGPNIFEESRVDFSIVDKRVENTQRVWIFGVIYVLFLLTLFLTRKKKEKKIKKKK